MIYKHIQTKQIAEVKEGSPREEGYKSSPSWVPVFEKDTRDGILAEMPKETLVEMSKEKGMTMHHTKDEIIESLEFKSKKLVPYFDDNLVG